MKPTHGHTANRKMSPTFMTWLAMRNRCFNKNNCKYPSYGANGITVCERWRNSFENFLADMGPRPEGHTIDRINGLGNYEPGNCRWATAKEQSLNADNERKGWKRRNTHCPSGHEFSPENTHISPTGYRKCKTCDRERARLIRAKKKAAA